MNQNQASVISLEESCRVWKTDKKKNRKKTILLIIAAVIVYLIFVNQEPFGHYFFPFSQALRNFALGAEYLWVHIWDLPTVHLGQAMPDNTFYFTCTYSQTLRLMLNFVGGMLLALSGMIFQNVFRNPLAAPTMLGVSNGVTAAWLILTLTVGAEAVWMPGLKYGTCFGCAAIVLAIVMTLAKLSAGHRNMSVNDLLLVGIAFSAVLGGIISGITSGLEESVLYTFQILSEVQNVTISVTDMIVMGGALIISIVPMMLMRFSFNTVSYSPDEMRGLGINSLSTRFFTLILGTFMMVIAMVQCGTVGMISLAVPHISRIIYGAEFKRSFVGNMILGGILMMLCRGIADMIPFVALQFPMGVIVNIIITPIFAFFMVRLQKQWRD